jgi:hypothetical protein
MLNRDDRLRAPRLGRDHPGAGHGRHRPDPVVPFGGMRKPVSTAGLSDHFPIAMTVREAD